MYSFALTRSSIFVIHFSFWKHLKILQHYNIPSFYVKTQFKKYDCKIIKQKNKINKRNERNALHFMFVLCQFLLKVSAK